MKLFGEILQSSYIRIEVSGHQFDCIFTFYPFIHCDLLVSLTILQSMLLYLMMDECLLVADWNHQGRGYLGSYLVAYKMRRMMHTAITMLIMIASLLFLKLIFCIKLFNAGKRFVIPPMRLVI